MRISATAFRVKGTGIFGVQCPGCKSMVVSPFNNTEFWDHATTIVRKFVTCQVCGLSLRLYSGYKEID